MTKHTHMMPDGSKMADKDMKKPKKGKGKFKRGKKGVNPFAKAAKY